MILDRIEMSNLAFEFSSEVARRPSTSVTVVVTELDVVMAVCVGFRSMLNHRSWITAVWA
jgi:hypothetical protein